MTPDHPPAAVPAALPPDEPARLAALRRYAVLDTAAEAAFDEIAGLAAQICGTPIALVSLVDAERQWFKARVGLDVTETPRDLAFCAHAILQPDRPLVVPDTREDARFATNPLALGEPHIRFYAGAPIVTHDGHALGTVCAIDRVPRELSPAQLAALRTLATHVARLLDWRQAVAQTTGRLEAQLEAGDRRLREITAFAAHGGDLTAYIDRAHVYRYVNEQYLERWGLTREAIEGRRVPDLIGEALYTRHVKPLLDRAFDGETVRYSAPFVFPVLGPRTMRVTYFPVRAPDGGIEAVVARSEDVDELERSRAALAAANAALEERNRTLQQFVQMMSHDIREPLNSICNFAGLLAEDHAGRLDDDGRRSLGFVVAGGQRMRQLLDDLLAYVQLQDVPSPRERFRDVDLGALMADVRADLDATVRQRQAQVDAGALPRVHGDPTMLRLMLQNLLSNALKFAPEGQHPQVAWGHEDRGDELVVWVRDAGIGIDPADVPRLFQPFTRLTTRRRFPGTGLGLALCRRVAELHGGRIEVDSAPGRGSTFRVHLPRGGTAARAP